MDNVVIMCHDPSLDRTTDANGIVQQKNWYGDMEHARTLKKGPDGRGYPVPMFKETIELLMRDGNRHVKFNVDVKVANDPEHIFTLIHEIISAQPNWETELAPRIILGLWHPKFIAPARRLLPLLSLAHIGMSVRFAREYFWDTCEAFSMNFSCLVGKEGDVFREDCKRSGKKVMLWTVDRREEMIEAVRWGVDVILTDVTKEYLMLRDELRRGCVKASSTSRFFLWTRLDYYRIMQSLSSNAELSNLERIGGPFEKVLASVQIGGAA